jgi:hypothetical protein
VGFVFLVLCCLTTSLNDFLFALYIRIL